MCYIATHILNKLSCRKHARHPCDYPEIPNTTNKDFEKWMFGNGSTMSLQTALKKTTELFQTKSPEEMQQNTMQFQKKVADYWTSVHERRRQQEEENVTAVCKKSKSSETIWSDDSIVPNRWFSLHEKLKKAEEERAMATGESSRYIGNVWDNLNVVDYYYYEKGTPTDDINKKNMQSAAEKYQESVAEKWRNCPLTLSPSNIKSKYYTIRLGGEGLWKAVHILSHKRF